MRNPTDILSAPHSFFALIAHGLRGPGPRTDSRPSSGRSGDLFQRIDRWFWQQRSRDDERYLAQAADVHDLERRIRSLERGPSFPYY